MAVILPPAFLASKALISTGIKMARITAPRLARFSNEFQLGIAATLRAMDKWNVSAKDLAENMITAKDYSSKIASEFKMLWKQSFPNVAREPLFDEIGAPPLPSVQRPSDAHLSGIHRKAVTYTSDISEYSKQLELQFTNAFKSAEDALVQFCMTGKMNFRQLSDSIIADLASIAAKTIKGKLTGGLAGALGGAIGGMFGGTVTASPAPMITPSGAGMFFAKGGVISAPALSAYSGSIVARPTLFPFAKGGAFRLGLMGEAGAEAIMPLRRGAGGRLGVDASGMGGGQVPQVNVHIHTPPGMRAETKQSKGPMGDINLDVFIEMIDCAMAGGIASGRSKTAAALNARGY